MCDKICRECKECAAGLEEDGSKDICVAKKNHTIRNSVTGEYEYFEYLSEQRVKTRVTNTYTHCSIVRAAGSCHYYEPGPPSDEYATPA